MDPMSIIKEHFADRMGWTDLRIGHGGYRVIASKKGDRTSIIEPVMVAGRSAGAWRGWVKLNRPEHTAMQGPLPIGWNRYILMVGMAPDDETVWWVAMYDAEVLRPLEWEAMSDGRWYRLSPEAARPGLIAIIDLLQQPLFAPGDLAADAPDAPVVTILKETIDAGLALLLDDGEIKRLDGEYLAHLLTRELPRVLLNVAKWREVRVAQSYSYQKSKAKA